MYLLLQKVIRDGFCSFEGRFSYSAPVHYANAASPAVCPSSRTPSSISKTVLLSTGGQTAQAFSVHLQSTYLASTWKAASLALLSQPVDFFQAPSDWLEAGAEGLMKGVP